MAKHDQRILKFLAQNSDRAPTITDMMTRLNISISEISASLSSLLAQGLIAKRTNNQGIECWFPAGNGAAVARAAETARAPEAPAPDPAQVRSQALAGIGMETRVLPDPRYHAAAGSHHGMPRSEAGLAVAEPPSIPAAPQPMSIPRPMPVAAAPAKSGVGIFTLLVAMAVTVMLSAFLANRLVERSVRNLVKGMVDQRVLSEAVNDMNASVQKSERQVKALEEQVRKLNADLAAMRGADSVRAVAAAKAPAPAAPAPAAEPVRKRRRR